MRKSRTKQKRPLSVRLLNLLIIVLLLAALVSGIRMVSELRSAFRRDPYENIRYSLQEENYSAMVSEYYRRSYDIVPFQTNCEEEYHVAEYVDAAFRQLFFEAAGDAEASARLEARRNAAREQCGALSVSADDVDAILERIRLYPQRGS